MTLLPDIKPSESCCGGGMCSSGSPSEASSESGSRCCVTMNCCTTAASSEMSIDDDVGSTSSATGIATTTKTMTTTATTTPTTAKVNNDLHAYNEQNYYDQVETNFPRCAEIDIDFENVQYTVRRFSFAERKFVTKEILHGINGSFRSGELTAIMGPSGSGKSTLLNVMSGFRASGVTGAIRVNGKQISTHAESFRKLSCYIHQDDLLRPQLTVGETMLLAAHLKLGFKVTKEHKLNLIKHILMLLGLDHRYNVFTAKLSGGQKKRLAIALELISNPPVLYLDEPTTGLDSSSCSQCVGLLKKLASQGHTIVCTIHQPSALIFEMFDKLYTVVDGNCMYQGPVRELVPFLADQQLVCPSYHNPADYLLEVAVGEHERDLNKLIHAANKKYYEDADRYQYMQNNDKVRRLITTIKENIENKTCNLQLEMQTLAGTKQNKSDSDLPTVALSAQFAAFDYVKPAADDLALEEIKALNGQLQAQTQTQKQTGKTDGSSFVHEADIRAASFGMQYLLLLQRILICARRNYFLLLARLISHIFIGVIFGYLYMSVGDKATTVLGNYVYLYGTTLLLVYTGKMAVVLTFPLELGMLTREHFNRWYKLGPYFLSLISFEIPFQSFCALLYILISVNLTGNNSSESFRLYYFIVLGVMATLSAQAWGFFVGATLPTKLAVFVGPILAVLFSVFGFCTRYVEITPFFRWMWHISYFRAGFHGLLNAIYGLDRPFLPCPDNVMYCHFRSPSVFLNYMMITDVRMSDCVTLMSIVIGVMHLLTLVTLWHKLNKR